ncbi:MAG: ABC-F family ATP-binding cassette domain-containing protein [Saprospiraceae bacterium]|nr:ABC-F family ATP-binding cassette domain-containing protein [Saprospiraceae bacterium]
MIQLQDIKIQYGERILFRGVTFQINPTDKIALIGRNGMGKSTLFNIITGELTPDSGTIQSQKGVRIGHLEQTITINQELTIRAAAEEAFQALIALATEHDELQKELETCIDYESDAYMKLLERFNQNLELLNHHDVDDKDKQIELVLRGLGFEPSSFDNKVGTLSGGWQMRVQLAKLLLQQPDLLLLDEPTNHLDIEAIIWLEAFIQRYPFAAIVISHDRAFLRNTADRIIEIEHGKTQDYHVDYDRFLAQKELIRIQQEAAYKNQQKEIAEKERTIKRFMAKATKTSMAQSMRKQLDKIDRIELDDHEVGDMRIRFLPVPRSGRTVVKGTNITKSYGSKAVLRDLSVEIERGDRVAIVGQNGQGKTTLAKILLNKLEVTSGEVTHGTQLAIGYYAQNQSDLLDDDATILEFMELQAPDGMRTRVRSLLGAFMFSGDDVDKKIKVLSGGEKARLAFAHLLMQPINLLVLDEPTNHLDMASKEILKQALMDYEGTLLVVSHDRDFLSDLTTKTIELRDHRMHTYLGDVNYFLEKRSMDDLRHVAMYKSEIPLSKTQDQSKESTLNREERKSLQREVQYAERDVFAIEGKIKEIEQVMSADDFYEKPEAQQKAKEYAALKVKLSKLEQKWERLVEQWERQG